MILAIFGFLQLSIADILDILLLGLIIFFLFRWIRGSSAMSIFVAIVSLYVIRVIVSAFNMRLMTAIMDMVLDVGVLALIVIFQPEIRRILATIGSLLFSESQVSFDRRRVTPEMLTDAILELSSRKIGALIAFERAISLRGYEESGIQLDAIPSQELFISIFTEPLPLHDGGVTMRNGRIASAHCLFPVSANPKLSGSGMRHRAAVGLSEETDALVIAVSEETKSVSIAHNGRIVRYAASDSETRSSLLRWMRKAMPVKKTATEQAADWFKSRITRFGKGKTK